MTSGNIAVHPEGPWDGLVKPGYKAHKEGITVGRKMAGRINLWYNDGMYHDLLQEYYGDSDFYNYGYWDESTRDQKSACENLMEKLLSFIPERKGRILDVACGKGATTAYLLRDFAAENVFGINISEKQLETARKRAPGATFLLMDAVQLDFEDNYFDHIICVEAVFHFETRGKFLEEAFRVMKPGGYLLLSDILLTEWGKGHRAWWVAESNVDLDADRYKEFCLSKGFSETSVIDATKECWECHCKSVARFSEEKLLARQMGVKKYETVASRIFRLIPHIETYVLLAAKKG